MADPNSLNITICFCMNQPLYNAVEKGRKKKMITRSVLIRLAILEYLENMGMEVAIDVGA